MFLKDTFGYIARWKPTWTCSQKTEARKLKEIFSANVSFSTQIKLCLYLSGFSHLHGDLTLLSVQMKVWWVVRTVWSNVWPHVSCYLKMVGLVALCFSSCWLHKGQQIATSLMVLWLEFGPLSWWALDGLLGLSQCYNRVQHLEPLGERERERMSCALAKTWVFKSQMASCGRLNCKLDSRISTTQNMFCIMPAILTMTDFIQVARLGFR